MNLRSRKHIIATTAVAMVVVAIIVIYGTFDPNTANWFPRCAFHTLTGLKCPGCGSQRALHALLEGNIAEAWSLNALMLAALPVMAFAYVVELRRASVPRLYRAVYSSVGMYCIAAIIIVWWVVRNIFNL